MDATTALMKAINELGNGQPYSLTAKSLTDYTVVSLGSSTLVYDKDAVETRATAILSLGQVHDKRMFGIGTTAGYPTVKEQLDLLYHDIQDGKLGAAATTGQWYVGITSVKTAFPKPS